MNSSSGDTAKGSLHADTIRRPQKEIPWIVGMTTLKASTFLPNHVLSSSRL